MKIIIEDDYGYYLNCFFFFFSFIKEKRIIGFEIELNGFGLF